MTILALREQGEKGELYSFFAVPTIPEGWGRCCVGIECFSPNNLHIIVRARPFGPSGVEWVALILDTGATHTVIDETFAFRLGYDLSSAPTVSLLTVSGTTQAPVIAIRQIFALGETVGDFQVLALPLPIQLRADGLLGLDLLRRRNLFCNFRRGIFCSPCQSTLASYRFVNGNLPTPLEGLSDTEKI